MTKDEALKLVQEALELLCVKCRSNEWGPDTPRKEILNWMHDHASKAHTAIEEALAQPDERNFCPRCGKRTADLTTVHTCTPPQEKKK